MSLNLKLNIIYTVQLSTLHFSFVKSCAVQMHCLAMDPLLLLARSHKHKQVDKTRGKAVILVFSLLLTIPL